MSKQLVVVYVTFILSFVLVGCMDTLIYKGESQPTHEVEEMLEDELEKENPNYDIEVDIQEGAK